jgi:phage recombination protein Bet
MANQPATATRTEQQPVNQHPASNVPALAGPRLPYHPAIEERFGVDRSSWKALVEAIFPGAQSTESVILALSYCKARNLDPFKRNVHIVPIWDKGKGKLVDTVWPGIGELRTTAFRTGVYAGRDATVFGDDIENEWPVTDRNGKTSTVKVKFPEWAQVTVYRMVKGNRVAFQGPRVYWMETFSSNKGGDPNSMWQKRPRGQLDKCAEASSLRAAFPEELGDDYIESEAGMIVQHGSGPQQGVQAPRDVTPRPQRVDYVETAPVAEVMAGEDEAETEHDAETGEIIDNQGASANTPTTAHSSPTQDGQAHDERQGEDSAAPSRETSPAAEGTQADLLGDGDDPNDVNRVDAFMIKLNGINNAGAVETVITENATWIAALNGLNRSDVDRCIADARARAKGGKR